MLINFFQSLKLSYSCEDKVIPAQCPIGSYSEVGSISCKSCPKGFFCPTNGTSCPKPCPVGTFSNKTGSNECSLCESGFKCYNVSETPVACSLGTYSNVGSVFCSECPGGMR